METTVEPEFKIIFKTQFSLNLVHPKHFSDPCTDVDRALKIIVDSALLPAEHGTELTFNCLKKYAKQDISVRAECRNGQISFTPGGKSSCTKIGTSVRLV